MKFFDSVPPDLTRTVYLMDKAMALAEIPLVFGDGQAVRRLLAWLPAVADSLVVYASARDAGVRATQQCAEPGALFLVIDDAISSELAELVMADLSLHDVLINKTEPDPRFHADHRLVLFCDLAMVQRLPKSFLEMTTQVAIR